MNRAESTRTHASLKALKALFADRYDHLPACRMCQPRKGPAEGSVPADADRLFREAMADVRPLKGNRRLCPLAGRSVVAPNASTEESDDLDRLYNLLEQGEGFVVEQTPEYMEWAGCDVPESVMRRLHRGDFSIQGHIDLHGLTVKQAHPVFDGFLSEAVANGKRTVLIIHGRGLSSPKAPVLKARVAHWLSRSPWRKWVIAFASARSCDGGAGATYVLLRQRPLSHRHRRKKRTHPM